MGHSRLRPITGTTPVGVGATYIVVDPFSSDTTIQCVANGTVTFTVDYTLQNILYDATAQAAVNIGNPNDRFVAPASAIWTNQIASGSISVADNFDDGAGNDILIFGIRINITAGAAGSVTYTVNQG